MAPTQKIYDLDYHSLADMVAEWNEPTYRAGQIWQGLYQNFYTYPDDFSNLPKRLRDRLSDIFAMTIEGEKTFSSLLPQEVQESNDGSTQKTLFRLPDDRLIETVLMRYDRRNTLCISTQSGCAMGCVFCATGKMGFGRHLSRGEIVDQVLHFARKIAKEGQSITNIVLMGMGEPFHNYDETMAAIDLLNDPNGMSLGARRFTISTVGLIPLINRFTDENRQVNLAVSLHAADNNIRSNMLPINKRYPLEDLLASCVKYVQRTHRRITFEWALIEGVNDTVDQAQKLAKILAGFKLGNSVLCHVNAIPLNPIQDYNGRSTTHDRAITFKNELEKNGIPCTIRVRRGIDIQAGCGQLAGRKI